MINTVMPQKGFASQALLQGLEDDGWTWDWTTLGTLKNPEKIVRAKLVAKSEGIWAGDAFTRGLATVEPSIKVTSRVKDGAALKPGMLLLEWRGPARAVLALERPFINLASYTGGIATQTNALVKAARKACPKGTPRVVPTRKTLPGYRDIAVYGVMAGGGVSHRVSLSGGVLIKENHIAAAGGILRAIEGARAVAPHGLLIEIEVRNAHELEQALKASADCVLLDNFTPAQVRAAVVRVRSLRLPVKIEVSGGINVQNIGEYSMPGVDVISSGSLTHSVRSLDLSLLITGASPGR